MDGQVRRRELAEKWRNAEFEGRTHLGPKPPGPALKTLSHFATVEEWEQHRKQVQQAQQSGAKF
jgi:hypothetical protein